MIQLRQTQTRWGQIALQVSFASLFATAASAATTNWNLNLIGDCANSAASPASPTVYTVGNCSSSSASAQIKGYSTQTGATSGGTVLNAATIYEWKDQYQTYGIGVVAGVSPSLVEDPGATGPHAMDNQYGTDVLLLDFGSKVTLSSFGIGWKGSDTDVTILAYQGAGTPAPVAGKTITGGTNDSTTEGTLLNAGWTVVGNYANVGLSGNSSTATVNTTISSSYWLISAYNTSFGSTNSNVNGTLGGGNDYFKILAVAGTKTDSPPPGVPEPGSLALMGAALLGLMSVRRRVMAPKA